MEKFLYVTQRKKNAPFEKGIIVAESAKEAERELASNEVPLLFLEKLKEKSSSPSKIVKKVSVPRLSLKEKISFAQNMEQCQDIDMGLLAALSICGEMALNKTFSEVCYRMRDTVSEGSTLYDAMRDTYVFDELALGLVRAGEKSGHLSKSFSQIKLNYRRSAAIRGKMIKLISYPGVVMFVASICIFFLMWKTVPTFVGLFATAKMELPLPTKILMFISNAAVHYPLFILAGIFALGFLMLKIPYFYRISPWSHNFILKLPIFGKLQKMLIQETFTRTLLNLLGAGLKIIDALTLCLAVSTCYPYKGAIARARLAVSGGSMLMVSLEEEKDIFGIIVVRTLGFGEKTGKTEKVLEPLANTLASEIMDYIDTLNTIIEPLLTLFIGAIVLLILLALFIPIFSLPKLL